MCFQCSEHLHGIVTKILWDRKFQDNKSTDTQSGSVVWKAHFLVSVVEWPMVAERTASTWKYAVYR